MEDLLAALYEQMAGIPQPGASPVEASMANAAALLAMQRANEYQSRPERRGPAGAMGGAANNLRAFNQQERSMGLLREALDKQYGIDQYKSQIAAIQERIKAAEEEARKRGFETYKTDEEIRKGKALAKPEAETQLIRNLRAAGIDPASKQGQALIRQSISGKNTTYNVTPPTDYTFADPSNPAAGFKVIPGSKTAQEMEQAQKADTKNASQKRFNAENVVNTIDRLLGSVGPTTAGWGGLAAEIPGSDAKTVKNDLNTVMANLAFDRLDAMRAASKTGGALGQVSERELELLKSSVAGLEQTQDPAELQKRLGIVRNSYQRFIDALNGKMPEGYDEGGNPIEGGADLERMAQEAIAAGADPVAVRKRIEELRGKQ